MPFQMLIFLEGKRSFLWQKISRKMLQHVNLCHRICCRSGFRSSLFPRSSCRNIIRHSLKHCNCNAEGSFVPMIVGSIILRVCACCIIIIEKWVRWMHAWLGSASGALISALRRCSAVSLPVRKMLIWILMSRSQEKWGSSCASSPETVIGILLMMCNSTFYDWLLLDFKPPSTFLWPRYKEKAWADSSCPPKMDHHRDLLSCVQDVGAIPFSNRELVELTFVYEIVTTQFSQQLLLLLHSFAKCNE